MWGVVTASHGLQITMQAIGDSKIDHRLSRIVLQTRELFRSRTERIWTHGRRIDAE
jgi:hypothetical protein